MNWRAGRYYTSSSYLRYETRKEKQRESGGDGRNEKVMRRQKLWDDMGVWWEVLPVVQSPTESSDPQGCCGSLLDLSVCAHQNEKTLENRVPFSLRRCARRTNS